MAPLCFIRTDNITRFFHFTRRLLFTVDDWIVLSCYSFFGAIFSFFLRYLYSGFNLSLSNDSCRLIRPYYFSRANVPFPPILEALFLEITIELLREAGARLPTKVGQTIGIVGGIVIGQASVGQL